MLVFIAILLSMSQVLAVKCELQFVDPVIPKYPESMESVSYLLGSMTPYHAPSKVLIYIISYTYKPNK
jgi:hypothetical protein